MPRGAEVKANFWKCCDCGTRNVYALLPRGSECPFCLKHTNVGCCRGLYGEGSSKDAFIRDPAIFNYRSRSSHKAHLPRSATPEQSDLSRSSPVRSSQGPNDEIDFLNALTSGVWDSELGAQPLAVFPLEADPTREHDTEAPRSKFQETEVPSPTQTRRGDLSLGFPEDPTRTTRSPHLPHVAAERLFGPEMVFVIILVAAALSTFGIFSISLLFGDKAADSTLPYVPYALTMLSWIVILGTVVLRRIAGIDITLSAVPKFMACRLIPHLRYAGDEPFELRLLPLRRLSAELWSAGVWFLQPPKVGYKRILFRCGCGSVVWSDYAPQHVEAATKLRAKIWAFFNTVHTDPPRSRTESFVRQIIDPLKDIPMTLRAMKDFLRRTQRGATPDSEAQPRQSQQSVMAAQTEVYLTCCSEVGESLPCLFQLPSADINGDGEYFDHLRYVARRIQRLWARILFPRKVVAIKYVQFQLLFDNRQVDIAQSDGPCFPSQVDEYDPVDVDLTSVDHHHFASETLVHFFEKKHKPCHYPHVLRAIPRKLKGKLLVPDKGSPQVGWGMGLIDGTDSWKAFLNGLIGLTFCALTGILWAKRHNNDVQGGTGITSCLMAFVVYAVTMRGVAEVR